MACTNEKLQQMKEQLVKYKHSFGDFWYYCSVGELVVGFTHIYSEYKNNIDIHCIVDFLSSKKAELDRMEKETFGYFI